VASAAPRSLPNRSPAAASVASGLGMATNTEPDGRLTALGNQLIEIHLWLREELAGLRVDVDAFLAGVSDRPQPLIGALGPTTDPVRVQTELDSLAALLESHFGYEEKKLVAALNALDANAGTAEDLLGRQ
jgi:hypothetical protein